MPSYQTTINLLKTFHNASNDILTDICLSQNAIALASNAVLDDIARNEYISMNNFIKISRGVHAPDSIKGKFETLSKGVLSLNPHKFPNISSTSLELEFIQGVLNEEIIPQLEVAAFDWKSYFPKELPYAKSQHYFADYQYEIMDTLELVKSAYDNTSSHIKTSILPNTSHILNDMGIHIR